MPVRVLGLRFVHRAGSLAVMSFALLRGNPQLIAIDFGVSSLKALQIEPGDPARILAVANLEVPDELRDHHSKRFEFQAAQLPKLLREAGFKARRAVCSVSAQTTLVQNLRAVRDDSASVQSQIEQQLQLRFGRPPSQMIIRFSEVADVHFEGRKCVEVYCTMMPREIVIAHMTALKSCKLEPVGVHSEHQAVTKIFENFARRADDKNRSTAFIDLGYGSTKVTIAHGPEAVFGKTVAIGGRNFDLAIAKSSSCSASEARRVRLRSANSSTRPAQGNAEAAEPESPPLAQNGIFARTAARLQSHGASASSAVADDRRNGAAAPGHADMGESSETDQKNAAAMSESLQALVEEIALCIRHHDHVFPAQPVDRAVFFGGESRMTPICRRVAEALGVHAQVADPLVLLARDGRTGNAGVALQESQPGFAVALGLCLTPSEA